MTKVTTYLVSGKKSDSTDLPKELSGRVNLPLLAQAIRVYENRTHPGLSKVKTRGEVVASKKKIWRQKGTGRARHGALSAPIFVGGGKAHGPKGLKRVLTLPTKMKKAALVSAVNVKLNEEKLYVVSGLSKVSKTKEVASLLKSLGEKSQYTFYLADKNWESKRYIRNIGNASVMRFVDMNAHDLYKGGVIIIDKDAFSQKLAEKKTQNFK